MRTLKPSLRQEEECLLLSIRMLLVCFLQRVDAEILRLYDFPPRLERQLLDLFSGYKRLGVPFDFRRYFPEDFEPHFPLHLYLSEEYQRSDRRSPPQTI